MKKIFILPCLLFFLFNFARAQSDWTNYKIDSKLSVKVPAVPEKSDEYSVITTGDDSLVYVITKIDMKKIAGLDSAALAGIAPTDAFVASIKTGMEAKMPGFILSDARTNKWNNYYCYYIDGSNATTKLKAFTFLLIISDHLYSLSVVMPSNKDTKPKDYFFASLKLR